MKSSEHHLLETLLCVLIAVGTTICCDQPQFIMDYAAFYSLSEIVIVSNTEQIREPIGHISVAYISYESTGAEITMEYIRSVQDEIELLIFIGSDNGDLLQLLDNYTDIFRSKVMNIMEVHPSMKMNFRLDTNILFCKNEGSYLALSESYAIKEGPTIKKQLGNWSTSSGLQIDVPMIWERRANLMNVQLTDTILPYAIVTRYDQNKEGDIVDKSGIFQDLSRLLQSRLNFSVKSVSPPDGNWGNLMLDNVTWSGIVGELVNNKADISSAGLGRTFERSKAIDYGITLVQYKYTLIQASIKSVVIQVWVYFTIFPAPAWIVLIVLLLMHAVVFAIIAYILENCRGVMPIENGVAISFLYLLQLSSDNIANIKKPSTKIGLLTWAFGCYVAFSYYEAQLTADMTSRPPQSNLG